MNIQAYDKVWVIGDSFVNNTFSQYFQNAFHLDGSVNYIKAHYDTTGFCKTDNGFNPNILSRIQNALIHGINQQVLLPKAIILVFDDILDALDHYKSGLSYAIGCTVEWLANQIHRIITAHKEKLPSKSQKFKYPMILWCLIPYHEIYSHYNDFKHKFNCSVVKTTALFREMETLQLDVLWDRNRLDYFTAGRINAVGLSTYWNAVSAAFETWDRDQMKAQIATKKSMERQDTSRSSREDRHISTSNQNRHNARAYHRGSSNHEYN